MESTKKPDVEKFGEKKIDDKIGVLTITTSSENNPKVGTYVNKMVEKNMSEEEAIEKFYINNESIFKKGAPYDIETPILPKDCSVPSPGKTVIECKAEARNKEVLKRCKANTGEFKTSTLYFGDGFYNYHIPKLVNYTVPGISI